MDNPVVLIVISILMIGSVIFLKSKVTPNEKKNKKDSQ